MDKILDFIKGKIDIFLQQKFGQGSSGIGFLATGNWDPLVFSDNQVTILLINVEEERTMRPPQLHATKDYQGKLIAANPDFQLNLYFLFVAKNNDYKEAWKQLFAIIEFFQTNRSFSPENTPDLPDEVNKLHFELVTLSFSEQNEVWSALKVPYHPSVMFKARSIFIQSSPADLSAEIEIIQTTIGGK
jgi:hypothetical protein